MPETIDILCYKEDDTRKRIRMVFEIIEYMSIRFYDVIEDINAQGIPDVITGSYDFTQGTLADFALMSPNTDMARDYSH